MSTSAPRLPNAMPRLRVSENRRFLVTEEGAPFFWLGDTCWHMFGKSVHEDTPDQPSVARYFATRAAQGFTVIQSVIVRWPDNGSSANAYGFEPFMDDDWSRPRLGPGANDDYWDHVDWCVAEARRNGLYLAALPMWLQAIEDGNRMAGNPEVAYRYGHFLGSRYGHEPHIVWVLGGDPWQKGRNVDTPSRLALVRALAEGIADGANGEDAYDGQADWTTTLMTFHPPGGNHSSGEWLHNEPWLDFNMIQTTTRFRFANWQTVARDYARTPPKPTFDAEVAYEESLSLNKDEPQDRRVRAWDVRRAAYWNVFAGGLGHTYGNRSFIGWIRRDETYHYGAHIPWYERLDAPGAQQMKHLRALVESRPFLSRIPDQSILVGDAGDDDGHLQATRDADGSYVMVYTPLGRPVTLNLAGLGEGPFRAWWYDPRTGSSSPAGEFSLAAAIHRFVPPSAGEDHDWVLVVDRQEREATAGPLRAHPRNSRYFADSTGRTVYLTGAHTWNNFADVGVGDPPTPFDFPAYLDFLEARHHNFIRLWRWELTRWDAGATPQYTTKADLYAVEPHPWRRTGPGQAPDGHPKFDLDQFDPAYFDRLRQRVCAARERGSYVGIMLFEGWGLQHLPNAWASHPFHPANNIQGLDGDADGDGRGLAIHTLKHSAVTSLQEAYVRRVIDAVNDLDNVLYEIVNESGSYSIEWQYHMIRFIKAYQQDKRYQHPVGMTFPYSADAEKRGTNAHLFASPADWVSPNPDAPAPYDYRTNPPPADGGKIVLSDTDHLWGIGGTPDWVWKSFVRGYNPLFMDPYDNRVLGMAEPESWSPIRRSLGYARSLAERLDLAAMTPREDLASTGYCLADPGREYLVYLPEGGTVTVNLSAAGGHLAVEWLDPDTGETVTAEPVPGGAARQLAAPSAKPAVLHIVRPD